MPIAKVDIDTDLLTLIDEGRINISMDDVSISMISIFELQARIAKYRMPAKLVTDAVDIINDTLKVVPFYNARIIEVADALSREIKDYIDCLILATAIALKEDLATEDSRLLKIKEPVKKKYDISIFNCKEAIKRYAIAPAS